MERGYQKICDGCLNKKSKCGWCEKTIAVDRIEQFEAIRQKKPIFCSKKCVAHHFANKKLDKVCKICEEKFKTTAKRSFFCDKCRTASCRWCESKFLLRSNAIPKVLKKQKKMKLDFELLKRKVYSCEDCLEKLG